MKQVAIIALFLVASVFADGVPDGKSFYWGGHVSWILGSAWNDKPVKGVFSVSASEVNEYELLKAGSLGLELGALCWFRLNNLVGFEGEANVKLVDATLNDRIYNRMVDGKYDEENDASLLVWSFNVPLVVRFTPTPSFFLESGAQLNVNLGGSISSYDDSFDFDVEPLGWSLVFGGGVFSYNPQNNLLWSAGIRLAVDMTRIEKEGIVEIRKGVAYREASPMKFWNFQCDLAFYF